MRRFVGVVVAGLFVAATFPAASASTAAPASRSAVSLFAGHWEADVKGDGRMFTFVFDFSVRGDSLGGKLSIAQREGEVPVTGTVKGNHLHFEQFGRWDGTIENGVLRMTRGLDGGKVQHMVAHRVAPH